jgi:cyclopropane fatty-acyl-phospholipid synthase-like methyltransferase
VFQHLGDATVRTYFLETARVLRPGGNFLFQIVLGNGAGRFVPFRERHPYAIRWRRMEEIERWLRQASLTTRMILRENGEELSFEDARACPDESLLFLAVKPCPQRRGSGEA